MEFVQPRCLVGASSGYRYACKAMLSTSFFCGYGPACIFWRLWFVIVPCSVSVDMVLHSFFGDCVFSFFQFKHGVLPHKSVRAAFNCIFYKRIVWSETQYALKAILATSFFCGYGLALILWRLCFVIVPCSLFLHKTRIN